MANFVAILFIINTITNENFIANKFVAVTYDLNVGEGEERELMERATAETPLKFIFGTGAMLPLLKTL